MNLARPGGLMRFAHGRAPLLLHAHDAKHGYRSGDVPAPLSRRRNGRRPRRGLR